MHATSTIITTTLGAAFFAPPVSAAEQFQSRNGGEGWADNTATARKSGGDGDWAARVSPRKDFDAATLALSLEDEEMAGRPFFGVLEDPRLPLGGRFDARVDRDSPSTRCGVALTVNKLFDRRYVQSLAGQSEQYGAPHSNITPPRAIAVEFRAGI